MRKLALKLDELTVESFDTSPRRSERGTVLGNSVSGPYEYSLYTGECCTPAGTYGGNTCESTCHQIACGCTYADNTCDVSCGTYGDGCVATAHPEAL
jgi:hypothetical protein